MAAAVTEAWTDEVLRADLSRRGAFRAEAFRWRLVIRRGLDACERMA